MKIDESVLRIAVEVGFDLIKWIADLVAAGEEDPARVIRSEILDRRTRIAADREARDRELEEKHGRTPPDGES